MSGFGFRIAVFSILRTWVSCKYSTSDIIKLSIDLQTCFSIFGKKEMSLSGTKLLYMYQRQMRKIYWSLPSGRISIRDQIWV